jgi:hypothetical protein
MLRIKTPKLNPVDENAAEVSSETTTVEEVPTEVADADADAVAVPVAVAVADAIADAVAVADPAPVPMKPTSWWRKLLTCFFKGS